MRGAGLLAAALLAAAALRPAAAAEGGLVRTGEHPDFTRVVLPLDPATEWSLETASGEATLFFPGRALVFDLSDVWRRIPRERVRAIEARVDPDGARLRVAIGCDCRITASFVGATRLALDVRDRAAPPPASPPETAEARDGREAALVASAEAALLSQIARAADQGVVTLLAAPEAEPQAEPHTAPEAAPQSEPHTAPEAAPQSEPQTAPEAGPQAPAAPEAAAPAPPGPPPADAEPPAGLAQVEATSVVDRDAAALRAARRPTPAPPSCLPDAAVDIASWATGRPLAAQAQAHPLVGEFDRPEPAAVAAVARLYLRLGLGAEAESLLAAFDLPIPDRPLLAALARAIEGRPPLPGGPLAADPPCPGAQGLWSVLAGAAPAFADAERFAAVEAAFGALPADLRALLGPRLAGRLLDEDRPAEARRIEIAASRAGGDRPDDALALLAARLDAAEGRPERAAAGMRALAESGGALAPDALLALARLALNEDYPLPDRLMADLRELAALARGTPAGAEARRLAVEARAARGDLPGAVAEARAGGEDARALAVRLVAAAPPGGAPAGYAAAALAVAPWIAVDRDGDAPRRTIAGKLIAVGLPNAALDLLAPALAAGDAAAGIVAARAELALGRPQSALDRIGDAGGAEAAALRAGALAAAGAPEAALAALDAAGAPEAAARYAWAAGEWDRAAAAATAPDRVAMAAFMAARAGAPLPAPADAPPPAAAFAAPLPGLARPSLAAAQGLLDRGPEIGAFVKALLAPAPAPAAAP